MQIERKKIMKSSCWHPFLWLVSASLLCACSATRHLPEDTYMLDNVRVYTDGKYKDINRTQMKDYVRQKGNTRWFSALKIPLGVYAMAGKDSSWLNRTFRNMGEAPVRYDTLLAQQSCKDLQSALQNKGYLDGEVELFIDQKKKKKVDAIYILHPGQPYYITGLRTDIRDSVIAELMKDYKPILKNGMQFNIDAMNQERSQVTRFLQDNGYFRFHKEFINYQAKKNEATKQVELTMILHPYRSDEHSGDTLHSRYWIRHISYESGNPMDSVIHLREKVLRENTFLEEGEP